MLEMSRYEGHDCDLRAGSLKDRLNEVTVRARLLLAVIPKLNIGHHCKREPGDFGNLPVLYL